MNDLNFTLSEYDIGNSSYISKDGGSLSFTYSTERGIMSINKSSVITFTDADGNRTEGATIDWLKRTIDIMGVRKVFSDIKIRPSGMFNSGREWQWSEKKFVTSLKDRIWTIRSNEEIFAVLTPVIIHTFGQDEPATLTFHKDNIPMDEMIFIIFAITFITLQSPPPNKKPKTAKATVGGILGGLAVDAASSAIVGCCSIQ